MSGSKHRDYFLGLLDEAASAEIELRVLDDIDFATELASAEEDLIEDFLDNSLSPEETDLFRTHYLNTEERIKNVEMTSLIRRLARENLNNTLEIDDSNSRKNVGFLGWFSSLGLGARLAAASVALVVILTSIWFILPPQSDGELLALQTRYEQINQNPDSLGLDTKLSELTLVSANLRSSGSMIELSRTDLTEDVRFRIALSTQTANSTTFTVKIFRDATEVFRQNNIRALPNSAAPELRLLLPREIFSAGNYRLSLTTKDAPDLNYYFVVK